MQNRKTLIVILCGLLVILLALMGTLIVVMMNDGNDSSSGYQKQIEIARKYLEEGNYEQSIATLKALIEDYPENEEAYTMLADIYLTLGRMEDMRLLLENGIANTASGKLTELYALHFSSGQNSQGDLNTKPEQSGGIVISDYICQIVANYTYEDYKVRFNSPTLTFSAGNYRVNFGSFPGVLNFFNDAGIETVDEDKKVPYDTARPNYVTVSDLGVVFGGMNAGDKINTTELSAIGAREISQKYDRLMGEYISFVYKNCVFEIAVDGEGNFTNTSAHKIYSVFKNTEPENKKYQNMIRIISATTGGGVSFATVNVRQNNSVVFTTVTDSMGYCTLELLPGKYTVEVNAAEYIVEAFDLEVFTTGVASVESFTISPQLADDEIRIVLEWGDYPRDLDSHLCTLNMNSMVNFTRKTWREGGEVVAELDVDDTTGYGPETITVYDTDIDFIYAVYDFTTTGEMFYRRDITVKVYTSSGTPTVYTIPTMDIDSNMWTVFKYQAGSFQTVNGTDDNFRW
ncbi:MAG: tetratricopeptide repeat protein [Clostridia bacterium]|nr:tetratricopeptide repeat protein [Clostridia bacterium]